jgi:hypothetical protein
MPRSNLDKKIGVGTFWCMKAVRFLSEVHILSTNIAVNTESVPISISGSMQ